jgi:hypothetical protein
MSWGVWDTTNVDEDEIWQGCILEGRERGAFWREERGVHSGGKRAVFPMFILQSEYLSSVGLKLNLHYYIGTK